MNVAALPQGLQPPLAGPPSGSGNESSPCGRSIDIEIALDQVTDLLTHSSSRVFHSDAAQALATALLQHYVPNEVANTLIVLSDEQIEQVRDGLLTGAVAIQRDQPNNPFVCMHGPVFCRRFAYASTVRDATRSYDDGHFGSSRACAIQHGWHNGRLFSGSTRIDAR